MKKVVNCKKTYTKRVLVISLIAILIVCTVVIIVHTNKNRVPEHRLQWWLTSIEWDKERTKLSGKGVTIAILDTGVDFQHNDLKSCDYEQLSVVPDSEENELDHGTAIAGIIAAYPHNSKGVLGIAPNSKIISIDVTNSETVDVSYLIKGIQLAISKNVDIINISIGVKEDDRESHSIIKEAYDKGIIIVASAGNYMKNEVLYPAAYDEVIAVGSLNKNGDIISPKGTIENVLFLPGTNISTCLSDNNYAGVKGTSFSTAILTGMLAIKKEKYPNLNNKNINDAINELASNQNKTKTTINTILKK